MHLGKNNACYAHYIGNESVKEQKDLGVEWILIWSFIHTSAVANKANQVASYCMAGSFFCKLKWAYPSFTLVRLHLEYYNIVWGPTFVTDLNIIESVQRQPTRYAQDVSNLTYLINSYICIFLPFPTADLEQTCRLWHNILHNNVNLEPNEFFHLHSNSITRGHDHKLFKCHAQRLVRSNNFSIRVINYWNNLPTNIANTPSINIFKKNLDSYFNCFTV